MSATKTVSHDPNAEFEVIEAAKSFPVPECRRVPIALTNRTGGLLGAHFVTYDGKEQSDCILWLRKGERKEVEWALGWVVRVRDHATKVGPGGLGFARPPPPPPPPAPAPTVPEPPPRAPAPAPRRRW